MHERFGVLAQGEVRGNRQHLTPALAPDLLGGRLEHVLSARADRDVGALAREHAGDALADAGAAARDQRYLAVELQVHSPPRVLA